MRRTLMLVPVLALGFAMPVQAQDPLITDENITAFLKGVAAERPELEKVADQLEELKEKLTKFRECYKLVAGADDATGKKLGGLAGKAMLKAKCGATSEEGFLKDKAKLLENPEKVGAAAAGLKIKDYSKIKESSELYLGGSRSFSEGALAVFAKHATALSNGLGLALVKPGAGDKASGPSLGSRVANAMGINLRAFTPDMTWIYVSYLWGLMYMSGTTLFEQPYKPGQFTVWEVTDSEQPDTKLLLERALISKEADKSEWWRIKTVSVSKESSDTIILESLFKPLDEEGVTMQVVRMRGKLPGDTEGKELMVPQHLTTLSMTAAFGMKPTPESVAGATVGTESIKVGSSNYSAKRVKFGTAGGSTEWWLADSAPGGVVRVQKVQGDAKWTMELKNAGSGAKSELGVK